MQGWQCPILAGSFRKLLYAAQLQVSPRCSLGNSLVITAVGGGASVLPFLTGIVLLLISMKCCSRLSLHCSTGNELTVPSHFLHQPLDRRFVGCSLCSVAIVSPVFGPVHPCQPALHARSSLQHRHVCIHAVLWGLWAAVSWP